MVVLLTLAVSLKSIGRISQAEELEALEAIFMDEFVPDPENPLAFSVVINDLDFMAALITLDFKHTPKYPDEAPEYSIQPSMQLLPGGWRSP